MMMMSTEEREERRRRSCCDWKRDKMPKRECCVRISSEAGSIETKLGEAEERETREEGEGRKDAPVSLTKAPSTTNSPLLLSLLSLPPSPPPFTVA